MKQQHTRCAVLSLQSCPRPCDPMDCSPSGSSVHGILQARTLERVPTPFSRGSSRSRDRTHISTSLTLAMFGRFFTTSATWEALLLIRKMQNKTTMRYYYTCTRITKINSDNTKCWWGCRTTGTLVHGCQGKQLKLLQKTRSYLLKRDTVTLMTQPSHSPVNTKRRCTHMFTRRLVPECSEPHKLTYHQIRNNPQRHNISTSHGENKPCGDKRPF